MIANITALLESISSFLSIVFADFVAIVIWWLIKESAASNISFRLRMRNWRFNCLAILYQEIRDARLSGTQERDIQVLMKEKYDRKALPFMLHGNNSPSQLNDLVFIENLINNEEALLRFASTPSFGKKEYNYICCLMGVEEKKKKARNAIFTILKDQSEQSVDSAMIWLPDLLQNYIPNQEGEDEGKKISMSENHYSIVQYCKCVYFRDDLTQNVFIDCVKALSELYPNIKYPRGDSQSTKYTKIAIPKKKREKAMLDRIKELSKQV